MCNISMVAKDQVGEAYVFFQYSKPDDLTEDESLLSDIRSDKTPKELELYLNKLDSLGVKELDRGLRQYVDMAKDAGANYCLAAKLPGASNEITAEEVAQVFNQLYLGVFDKGEDVLAEILYKDDSTSQYVFRE